MTIERNLLLVPATLFLVSLLLLSTGCSKSEDTPTGSNGNVTVSVNDVTETEGSTAAFRISLSGPLTQSTIVQYTTNNVTALGGIDYTSLSITQDTIAAGDTVSIVFVTVLNTDSQKEFAETYQLLLLNVSNGVLSDSIGLGTILDTDGARFSGDVKPLMLSSCALVLCHSPADSANAGGKMYLGQATYSEVLAATGFSAGGKVVIPGDSTMSLLYTRLRSITDNAIQMPKGLPFLADSVADKVGEWIHYGAQNN